MKTKIDYFIMPLLVIAMAVCAACGGDDYDDSDLWNKVNSNTSRIEKLEAQVNQINNDIAVLKSLLNISQDGITITKVTETVNGYSITFSDGNSIEIKNGKNGQDSSNAPIVGVELYNGIYYWTLTVNGVTNWLTDDHGNKIQASGQNGKDGQNGTNGKDGLDGVTPLLRVDADGYWQVSYDGGKTYVSILDVTGNKVRAVATGGGGQAQGSIFYDVTINSTEVIFVLNNGNTFSLPLDKPFALRFAQTGGFELPELYSEVIIPFAVTGYDYDTFVEICAHGNIQADLTYYGGDDGSIRVRRTGDITIDTKVIVFLCNKKKTITYVLTFNGYVDDRLHQVVPDEILEKVRVYIPIYEGVDPPFVEGSYLIDKMTCVYCSDNGYQYGDEVIPTYIRFQNQNRTTNTLDFEEKEGDSYSTGNGAFISGSGNNFTVFFNTEGYSKNIWNKKALVISGTWTVSGIKDLYYAFVMVDKAYDPNPDLMAVGGFRVFEDQDGMAENASWSLTRGGKLPTASGILKPMDAFGK